MSGFRHTILAVGKLRNPQFIALCADFEKRLKRYAEVRVIDVKDSKERNRKVAIESEAAALIKKLDSSTPIIALTRVGRTFDSVELARWLEKEGLHGRAAHTFVIGGPNGLAASLTSRASMKISLSALTMTHEMARFFLLEQLYRASTIIRGEPYHRRA